MTIRRDDAPLATGIDRCKDHERSSGGHSWGYAISDGEKLELFKQTGTIDEFKMSPEAEAALVHTRLATRGEITQQNAHPFLVEWEGHSIQYGRVTRTAALAHNGTWYGAPTEGTNRCDSYFIAQHLQDQLRSGLRIDEAIEATGAHTGETFVVLTDDARCFAHSGRFDITKGDDAIQSSGLASDIPTGTVTELSR